MPDRLKIFTGNAHRTLAKEVANSLDRSVCSARVSKFSDGEIMVHIDENVRGCDVFIVQPTCAPVNDNLMELLLMTDAMKRASATRITAVMPYYGYARQDRKVQPRVPISSKLVADLITAAGVNRILTLDLHAGQIQGFFNIPVDHLYATPILLDYIQDTLEDLVVVSPDAGGVERARAFAKKLNASLAIVDKRREKANVSEVMRIIGNVKGLNALLLDDMIDTAGTISQAAAAIKAQGAASVFAVCTHPVLSGPAIERLNESVLDKVIVTNTIPLDSKMKDCPKIVQLSAAPLLGKAIKSIHEETTVSSLFV